MAAEELKMTSAKGDELELLLSPSRESTPPVLNVPSAFASFSTLTPCQFGISVQSFTPAASSNCKDKSRLAQIKARRRRSNIGARGSPETNSLIRFMAQERMKTSATPQTPEQVRSIPLFPHASSTLRQKMASFQSLMDVEESEVCDLTPKRDSNTGGCIKTRDYLSDGNSKENHPPEMTAIAKRRRCMAPLDSCEVEIRDANTLVKSKEQEVVAEAPVTPGPLPSNETELISPRLPADPELLPCSTSRNQQTSDLELQSTQKTLAGVPTSPAHLVSPFRIPSLPSLMELKPTAADDDSAGTPAAKKKKRVRFGGPLSPELFDKNLPPSTPLQKGGTPARAATPGGALHPRSLLKTPQRSEVQTPQTHSDLCGFNEFGASPTLALPRHVRIQSLGEESEDFSAKIVFPSMEEIDSALTSDAGCIWDSKPLDLNSAFNEECPSPPVTESGLIAAPQMNGLDELVSSQPEAAVQVPVKSRTRRKKQSEPECESASEAPTRSCSRKRKHAEESEPMKRSKRSASKVACGKMKKSLPAVRQWNRDVNRSLYGSRAYASKTPALSPIFERLPPAAETSLSAGFTEHTVTKVNPDITCNTEATVDLAVTCAVQKASEESVLDYNKKRSTGKGRRLSGPRSKGRGMKKRRVHAADCGLLSEEPREQMGEETVKHCKDQKTATNPKPSREQPLHHSAVEQTALDIELNDRACADALSTDSEGKSERPASLHSSPCSGEELNSSRRSAEQQLQNTEQDRRTSTENGPVVQDQEQVEQVKEQTRHEVEKEDDSRSTSDTQQQALAPWQADFNFEDVFKPVPTRGQRSVRRSLRNLSTVVSDSTTTGLAWLPRNSPDNSKESRRRTRGRRLSAALPVQPSASEETEHDAS